MPYGMKRPKEPTGSNGDSDDKNALKWGYSNRINPSKTSLRHGSITFRIRIFNYNQGNITESESIRKGSIIRDQILKKHTSGAIAISLAG